jgi:hypothetical protein
LCRIKLTLPDDRQKEADPANADVAYEEAAAFAVAALVVWLNASWES